MATYAIGDVQGCATTLARLLERIGFDESADRLWFVGDLVNRGPGSLEVLRRVKGLGERAVSVLGNHELHLLAAAAGVAEPRRRDTLDEVLAAPDRDELCAWVAGRPLLHEETVGDTPFALVHAGIPPRWSLSDARTAARELESALRGHDAGRTLAGLRSREVPADDVDSERGRQRTRLRATAAGLTRMRACTPDGEPVMGFTGPPGEIPEGTCPWFDVPDRRAADVTIVCGHWASLGLHLAPRVLALDTGCVWGGALTAVRLEDRAVFSEPCSDAVPARG